MSYATCEVDCFLSLLMASTSCVQLLETGFSSVAPALSRGIRGDVSRQHQFPLCCTSARHRNAPQFPRKSIVRCR